MFVRLKKKLSPHRIYKIKRQAHETLPGSFDNSNVKNTQTSYLNVFLNHRDDQISSDHYIKCLILNLA